MKKTEWILCPLCGNKTRNRVREDTVLINYPLYCPKCRQETLIEAKKLQVEVFSQRYSPVYLYLCSLVANFPNQELSDKDKELIRQYTTNRYFKG